MSKGKYYDLFYITGLFLRSTYIPLSIAFWNSNLNAETIIYWLANQVRLLSTLLNSKPESINFNRRRNVCYLLMLTLLLHFSTLFSLRDCKYRFKDNLVIDLLSMIHFKEILETTHMKAKETLYWAIKYLRVKGIPKILLWWLSERLSSHVCDAIYITNINQLTYSRRKSQISGLWLSDGKLNSITFFRTFKQNQYPDTRFYVIYCHTKKKAFLLSGYFVLSIQLIFLFIKNWKLILILRKFPFIWSLYLRLLKSSSFPLFPSTVGNGKVQ